MVKRIYHLICLGFVAMMMSCSVYSTEQLNRDFPYLTELMQQDEQLVKASTYYLQLVSDSNRIKTEADLLEVIHYRDSVIIPRLEKLLSASAFIETTHPIFLEVQRMGIFPISAEGMYTGLAPDYLLKDKVNEVASPSLQLYLHFMVQHGKSKAGEYPFVWMEPEKEMLLAGERLYKSHSKSEYWKRVKPIFDQTLVDFLDLHVVEQKDLTAYFVGGTSMEFWPYVTEIEPRQDLLDEAPDAFFAPALKSVLEKPSALLLSQEHIYLVVDEWFRTAGGANLKRLENFYKGKATPHVLHVELMNGNDQYALAYRFHHDYETAFAYLAQFKKENPNAEVIKATGWRGETLVEVN